MISKKLISVAIIIVLICLFIFIFGLVPIIHDFSLDIGWRIDIWYYIIWHAALLYLSAVVITKIGEK